jgi:redox-sensitive bicupin YhaK (pirin superfamily)
MGLGVLRVLNDDIIDPRSGFGKHGHSDMEIITIVTDGVVAHEDSMGNTYEVPAGDIQVMSAGTGVVHAELNRRDDPLKLFQIWITPHTKGLPPRYDQKSFGEIKELNKWELLVSGKDGGAPLWVNQDIYISRVVLEPDLPGEYLLKNPKNGVYVFVMAGSVEVEDVILGNRDAIAFAGKSNMRMCAQGRASLLLFEVPMK